MTPQEFDALVERRVELIKSVLKSKAGEYATAGDRLHNFNRAAYMLGISKEKALVGMWTKHVVSILDIVDSGKMPAKEMLDEKIGDAINYLILLEACYADRVERYIHPKVASKTLNPVINKKDGLHKIKKQNVER